MLRRRRPGEPSGIAMLTFAYWLAVAYTVFALLSSAASHLVGLRRFARTIQDHGVLDSRTSAVAAVGVVLFELGAGGAIALTSVEGESTGAIRFAFAGCAAAGVLFTLYVRRLLRRPTRIASCGCSPLGGPLTPASLLPGLLLTAASVVGLAASLGATHVGFESLLSDARTAAGAGWGATLAGLVILFPASAPSAELEGTAS